MNKVDMGVITNHLGLISQLGSHLGGKYFKVAAKETWTDFTKQKRAIETNPNSPDLILNRSPRKIEIRDFDVVDQKIETDLDGTTCVVFNPGTDTQAKAAIVVGEAGFGKTSKEALQEALTTPGGTERIFANGTELVKMVNDLNQNELNRLLGLKKAIQAQIDTVISTMNANKKKVEDYEEALIKSTPKPIVTDGGTLNIQVEEA